ncbi:hypothetical protein OESDEN_00379 [Oesophagostomum dentatum]|uniref:Uncharacterized protein n=1 Tax=Oesophagostomum dentatum TaxID=61180 RepID=A0A0B1TQ05_OESDE|nr:hypothetical protein OESDEN_00379 [Oesophagostomum dentatum]
MQPESVQNNRDSIASKVAEDLDPQKFSQAVAVSSSDNETLVSQRINHPLSVCHPPPAEVYCQPKSSQTEMPHILMKITENYRQLCSIRKSTELAMSGYSLRAMIDSSTSGSWSVFHGFLMMLFTVDSMYRTYRLVPPELYGTM